MGGGEEDGNVTKALCQMCDQKGHTATACPWLYTKCNALKCGGLMIMQTSESENTVGKKYLKCQHNTCGGWLWLEDAIYKPTSHQGAGASSSNGCFECGENDHWVRNCPWKETTCPGGCKGIRKLWTSRQQRSYGNKFLKCLNCGNFEWLVDAKGKCNKDDRKCNVRVKIEVSLDDLCNAFEKNIIFKP